MNKCLSLAMDNVLVIAEGYSLKARLVPALGTGRMSLQVVGREASVFPGMSMGSPSSL